MSVSQWAEAHRVKIVIDYTDQPGKVTITGQDITTEAQTLNGAMDKWEQAYLVQMYDQGKPLGEIMQEQKSYLG